MGKIKIMGFHQVPLPFSLMTPIPKWHPPPMSPRIHQKMRKGCRNDYLEAFGAVYWAKKLLKILRGATTPFGVRGLTFNLDIKIMIWHLWHQATPGWPVTHNMNKRSQAYTHAWFLLSCYVTWTIYTIFGENQLLTPVTPNDPNINLCRQIL